MASTSSPCKRLDGKVAIITGGASGIGEASVHLFVKNGAFVVIADIQDELGTQLENKLGVESVVFKHCDVTIETEVEELVAFTIERYGKLDIMYNNAGILPKAASENVRDLDMSDFNRVLAVNVCGMAHGIKHASKAMVNAKTRGVILCTSSVASIMAGLSPVAYTVSKHAVLGLVRAASSDLGKYGIRVNCVSPWGVITPLMINYLREATGNPECSPEEAQSFRDSSTNLDGHNLTPLDVAYSALYLASDEAAFVSGLNLIIDGGFTATNHSYGF